MLPVQAATPPKAFKSICAFRHSRRGNEIALVTERCVPGNKTKQQTVTLAGGPRREPSVTLCKREQDGAPSNLLKPLPSDGARGDPEQYLQLLPLPLLLLVLLVLLVILVLLHLLFLVFLVFLVLLV